MGFGVPQDYAEAMKWFRLAADQGIAIARAELGFMYANGQGVPQDYAEAAKWLRLAADQGLAAAQDNLGFSYSHGRGVPQDYEEAAKWLRKAADQGYANAQFNLGVSYANGQGVPKDDVHAHMWLNLAAAKGVLNASEYRDSIVRDMNSIQVAEAKRLAREWAPTGASQPSRQLEVDTPEWTIDATKPLVLSAPNASAAPTPTTSSVVAHIPPASAKKVRKKALRPSINRDDPDQERQRLY